MKKLDLLISAYEEALGKARSSELELPTFCHTDVTKPLTEQQSEMYSSPPTEQYQNTLGLLVFTGSTNGFQATNTRISTNKH